MGPNNKKIFFHSIIKCYCQVRITHCHSYYSSRPNTYSPNFSYISLCLKLPRWDRASEIGVNPKLKQTNKQDSEIRDFPQIFIVQEVLQGSFLSPLGACRFRLLLHTS